MFAKNIIITFLIASALLSPTYAQSTSNTQTPQITQGSLNGVAYITPNSNEVYGYNQDTYFKPASTEKIITALAALLFLGPDFQYKTSLLIDKNAYKNNSQSAKDLIVINGTLKGSIQIKFSGDPYFKREHLKGLLNSLKTAGIKKIDGDILLNYGHFAGHDYAPGWSWDDLSKCFTAPPSSIIIDNNCSSVQLVAKELYGKASVNIPVGTPITVVADDVEVVRPNEYYGGCDLEMDRNTGNVYYLSGCIPVQKDNKPLGLSLAIQDPNQWAIDNTKKAINSLDIEVNGEIKAVRKAPETFNHYASYNSVPLKVMLDRCLKKSVNIIADSIARTIGTQYYKHPANYHNSMVAIRNILKKHNIDIGNATLIDGSGLSAHNYITPRQMLNVLKYIKDHDDKLHMIKLLPVAGQSGTLAGRGSLMKEPLLKNVTAKTGTLNGVSNLAGFLHDKNGKLVPFVYFTNNLSYDAKTKQKLDAQRMAKPHYPHEKATLEKIYNGEKITKPF